MLHVPPSIPPLPPLGPCLQKTPASTVGGGPKQSGGSVGAPVQTAHVCPLHTGGGGGGQGHGCVGMELTSARYRFSSATLMAAPPPQRQAPVQSFPVLM